MWGNAFLIAGILNGVDPSIISALCFVESRHTASAYRAQDGHSASYGICQIKLATARGLGFRGRAGELMDPATNIYWAAKYFKEQLRKFGTVRRAISAYNGGKPLKSNRAYVEKVMGEYNGYTGKGQGLSLQMRQYR